MAIERTPGILEEQADEGESAWRVGPFAKKSVA
jgi:hypothetical protein